MTIQKLSPAFETLSLPLAIPKTLQKEAIAFARRNLIDHQHICPRCIKAHLISHIRENDISKALLLKIESLINEEAGHVGYYMDEGKIIGLLNR